MWFGVWLTSQLLSMPSIRFSPRNSVSVGVAKATHKRWVLEYLKGPCYNQMWTETRLDSEHSSGIIPSPRAGWHCSTGPRQLHGTWTLLTGYFFLWRVLWQGCKLRLSLKLKFHLEIMGSFLLFIWFTVIPYNLQARVFFWFYNWGFFLMPHPDLQLRHSGGHTLTHLIQASPQFSSSCPRILSNFWRWRVIYFLASFGQ